MFVLQAFVDSYSNTPSVREALALKDFRDVYPKFPSIEVQYFEPHKILLWAVFGME